MLKALGLVSPLDLSRSSHLGPSTFMLILVLGLVLFN